MTEEFIFIAIWEKVFPHFRSRDIRGQNDNKYNGFMAMLGGRGVIAGGAGIAAFLLWGEGVLQRSRLGRRRGEGTMQILHSYDRLY